MAEYARQHYVPVFLLKQWYNGPDAQLTRHSFQRAGFLNERRTARVVGFEKHLYSSTGFDGTKDVSVEQHFMGPHVDDPASRAHTVLLNEGLAALSPELAGQWVQFLVSLLVRNPRRMAKNHQQAREILDKSLQASPERDDPQLKSLLPNAYSQIVAGALPNAIQSEFIFNQFVGGRWMVRHLDASCPYTLLIGDHPLIQIYAFNEDPVLVLPMSPRTACIFHRNDRIGARLASLSDGHFAKAINRDTVDSAERYVFASDDRHAEFVRKYLKTGA